jgi:hypothetical protein
MLHSVRHLLAGLTALCLILACTNRSAADFLDQSNCKRSKSWASPESR